MSGLQEPTQRGRRSRDSAEPSRSAADGMIHAIKDAIHERRIVPGQRLVEPDLVAMFGSSRGTVREALQRLATEGVVVIERFRGARVRRLSRADVLELNLIREVLEGAAAAQAAHRIDGAGRSTLAALEERWDTEAAAVAPDSPSLGTLFGQYNTRFHDLVIGLSGQTNLRRFIANTELALIRLEFSHLLALPSQMKRSRVQHRQIVGAILAGDAAGAESAMRTHIRSTAGVIAAAPDSYFA
jgi:DNA-binding GntR family transcriptional regulator